jgi:pimeloyl-ACP methyl ester carboxylesterase
MKKWLGFGWMLLLSSCFRLDSNLFNNQEKISAYRWDAFTGEREIKDLPASYAIPANQLTELSLLSDDGGNRALIRAVYLGDTADIQNDTVILYCHGNKNHMDFYWNRAKLLSYTGFQGRFGVLMMDYRGYGLSQGEPSESGLMADVSACMQFLKDRGLKSGRLVMYGFSLGSAPATRLAVENSVMPVSRLILESPFASAQSLVEDAARLSLPASYFTNLSLNNEELITRLQVPFLLIHGKDDDFLRYEAHGKRVFDACPPSVGKKQFAIDRAVHNNVPSVMGFPAYSGALLNFISGKP